MEVMNPCLCCLQRPAEKNIKTPYSCLGITEIYADMIEGCFVIQLLLENPNDDGICEECVGRLRDARDFKLQVQRSQVELQARLERAQQANANVTPKPEITDDERCNSLILSSDEKPPVKCEAEATGGGADEDDVISHNESEDVAVKSEFSDDGNDENGENEDGISMSRQDAGAADEPAQCASARARQQLAMACLFRARRTSRDTLEHAASLASRASHAQGHGTGPSDTRTYTCAPCGKRFARKTTLIKHLREHMMQTRDQKGVNPLEGEASKKQFTQKMNSMRHRRIHTGGKVCTCEICKAGFAQKNRTNVRQKYSCEVCSNTFATKAYLTLHIRIHAGEKSYVCNICKKGFALKNYLRKHISTHMARKYSCETCSITFVTKARLALHRRFHTGEKSYTCDICNKCFERKVNLRKHISTHMRQKYSCDDCSETFGTKACLTLHRRIHAGEKSYTCDICNKCFERKDNLRKHISIHMRQKYSCDDCSETFGTKTCLTLHRRIPAGEKSYTCDICKKGFKTKSYLRQHISTHMRQTYYSFVKLKTICEVCGKQFARNSELKKHIKIHSGLKPYSCDICKNSYTRKSSLITHKKVHTGDKPHSCEYCDKKFLTRSQVTTHHRVHTGDRPYSCQMCDMKFKAKKHLINHTRRHTGEKPFSCDVCNMKFAQNFTLAVHKRMHTADKPFSCDECHQRFRYKTDYTLHLITHGIKAFICDACGKQFAQQRYLNLHIKNMHTGLKASRKVNKNKSDVSLRNIRQAVNDRFICDLCQKSFTSKCHLRRHIRKQHMELKLISCEICRKQFVTYSRLWLHKLVHTGDKPVASGQDPNGNAITN